MKIFSPRSRNDWKTFLISAQPLRAPNWIIDITRPQNGCGGCKKYPMNSKQPNQATWRTSDGSSWWLRSTRYSEPNGDYHANCFMALRSNPSSEDTIGFNDLKCNVRSRSYYCQPKHVPKKKKVIKPRAPVQRLVPYSKLQRGLKEEVFYFKQGVVLPDLQKHIPSMFRSVAKIQYPKTVGTWKGLSQKDNFAVRWSGFILISKLESNNFGIISKGGQYKFGIQSDDGVRLHINNKVIINSPKKRKGYSNWIFKTGKVQFDKIGQHSLKLEYFEKQGASGVMLKYSGADTGGRWKVPAGGSGTGVLRYFQEKGFKEEIYYGKEVANKGGVMPNLNRVAAAQRIVPVVNYKATAGNWPGFTKPAKFAVRWSGELQITKTGRYQFQLASSDGSKLYIRDAFKPAKIALEVDNDGIHSLRKAEGTMVVNSQKWKVLIECFQDKGDKKEIQFLYMGAQTKFNMVRVPAYAMLASFADPVKSPEPPKPKKTTEKKKSD
jgi:hypothetical protein